MNSLRFGTDGIRGPAENLLPAARHVGHAVALQFPGTVLVGGDPRESSAGLIHRMDLGLSEAGAEVIDVGTIPTPGLAYLAAKYEAAGVMISASHNPWSDNGIKVFGPGGDKLSDAQQDSLERYIADDYLPHKAGGTVKDGSTLRQEYQNFLVGSAEGDRFDGLQIAIDCANGAASEYAPQVFARLGAAVTPLFVMPDGRNINKDCGATNTSALQQKVIAEKLDLGLALDGDADRLMLVDGEGKVLNGDHILYILAVTGGLDKVVATQMSNLGLEKALAERGISLHRTDVGDRYVLAGIEEIGAQLGGEQSGHIILPERLATGDGMLTAIQVIRAVRKSGKTLEQWREELDQYILPQKIVNIPLANKTQLGAAAKEFEARELDQLGNKGRLNIRPSGTEPLARVMVEAPDADTKAHDIAKRLQELIGGLGKLRLVAGRNQALEGQLITKTRQPHISGEGTGKTPNDLTRFGGPEMLKEWFKKGRDITWLVEPTSDPNNPELAGIVWTGEEAFPFAAADGQEPPKLTLAIRLYEGYTGKKLSAPFIRHALLGLAGKYRSRGEDLPGIWLQTDDDNDYAWHTYERLGFKKVDSRDGRTTMVLSSDDFRAL